MRERREKFRELKKHNKILVFFFFSNHCATVQFYLTILKVELYCSSIANFFCNICFLQVQMWGFFGPLMLNFACIWHSQSQYSYITWHDMIELFYTKYFWRTTISHVKLNKENSSISHGKLKNSFSTHFKVATKYIKMR